MLRQPNDARQKLFIINEDILLSNLQSSQIPVTVANGEPVLAVTLVYPDPPAAPCTAVHTVNDLNLKVVSPSGMTYWGNCGLRVSNWSAASCLGPNPPDPSDPLQAPVRDTVENVLVSNPAPGTWTIHVEAAAVVQDGHVQTPALDADFALVARGVTVVQACCLLDGECIDTDCQSCEAQNGGFRPGYTCASIPWVHRCRPAYGPQP